MATTKQEIDSFARFAKDCLDEGDTERSIDELFDLWRIENPSPERLEQDALAVKASLRDLENGDRGMALDNHIRKMRTKYRIADPE